MRDIILPQAQGPEGHAQYDGEEEYCDLSTTSEVFSYFYYPAIFMFMQSLGKSYYILAIG